MSVAMSVVKKFILLSQSGMERDPLTNLRIQKLLYFSQGWSITLRGCDLFSEKIVATKYGPLVPGIYKVLPRFRTLPFHLGLENNGPKLYPDENQLIESVWESYKMHSATKLCEMVCSETPWKATYGVQNRKKGFAVIKTSVIAEYFATVPVPEPLAKFSQWFQEEELAAQKRIQQMPKLNLDKIPVILTSKSESVKEK